MIVTKYLFSYLLTILSRSYSCVCHTAPWWTATYSLYGVRFRMLKVSVTLPLQALTVPLFLTAVITWGHILASWLNFVFQTFLSKKLSLCLYVWFIGLRLSHLLPLLIKSCFCFLIVSQSMSWYRFVTESRPNIYWSGVYCIVVCTVPLVACRCTSYCKK